MSQFDVYANLNPRSSGRIPFLVDIQADLLSSLATRLMVPLKRHGESDLPAITRLHPQIDFGGKSFSALVSEMAALPKSSLGSPIGSVSGARADIIGACDLLITGF